MSRLVVVVRLLLLVMALYLVYALLGLAADAGHDAVRDSGRMAWSPLA